MGDKRFPGESALEALFGAIKSELNNKVDKFGNKELVNPAVENLLCTETTAGTYSLKATIDSNGNVSYGWVSD